MAREIKFRGLRTDGEGWVYGYYFYDRYVEEHYIIEDFTNVQVLPESIGQFIGVTDKFKREIYEGDVVLDDYYNKYVIKWCGDTETFRAFKTIDGNINNLQPIGHIRTYSGTFNNSDVWVKGNIHESEVTNV